jgi:hypothetical protein
MRTKTHNSIEWLPQTNVCVCVGFRASYLNFR